MFGPSGAALDDDAMAEAVVSVAEAGLARPTALPLVPSCPTGTPSACAIISTSRCRTASISAAMRAASLDAPAAFPLNLSSTKSLALVYHCKSRFLCERPTAAWIEWPRYCQIWEASEYAGRLSTASIEQVKINDDMNFILVDHPDTRTPRHTYILAMLRVHFHVLPIEIGATATSALTLYNKRGIPFQPGRSSHERLNLPHLLLALPHKFAPLATL